MLRDLTPEEGRCSERQEGHKKVFASYILTSNPPQFPWICENCGFKGVDIGGYTGVDKYDELVNRFRTKNNG